MPSNILISFIIIFCEHQKDLKGCCEYVDIVCFSVHKNMCRLILYIQIPMNRLDFDRIHLWFLVLQTSTRGVLDSSTETKLYPKACKHAGSCP